MDIASVIITFMVACRVLPRFTLDPHSDHPTFTPALSTDANMNFFLFNHSRTLCSLICTREFDNSFPINSFRTLLQKHRGWGTPQLRFQFCSRHTPLACPERSRGVTRHSFTLSVFSGRPLTLLFPAHPKIGSITPLKSALPKLLNLKSFRIRTSRKIGRWGSLLLTKFPTREFVQSESRDLSTHAMQNFYPEGAGSLSMRLYRNPPTVPSSNQNMPVVAREAKVNR